MAVYPIKMLKDEGNNPFVPLVGTNAIVDAQGQSLDDKFATKLEAFNIIAGENITLQKVGNNITINGGAGSSVSLIDNLTTDSPGLGALDARQGKALKDLIPAVINNLNSTSTTSALSAYQGYLLKNRVVPAGGTTGQVLKKSSNADNAVEWGDMIKVENSLTSTSTINALSAAQGKILNEKFSNYALTSSLKTVATTGSYNDLTNKPTIPTTLSQLSNNANYGKGYSVSGKSSAAAAIAGLRAIVPGLANETYIDNAATQIQNNIGSWNHTLHSIVTGGPIYEAAISGNSTTLWSALIFNYANGYLIKVWDVYGSFGAAYIGNDMS